jgi:hypothetical protein
MMNFYMNIENYYLPPKLKIIQNWNLPLSFRQNAKYTYGGNLKHCLEFKSNI